MKYANKTIEYGLYLLVFILPLQTRWIVRDTGLEYANMSLYGTDILLAFLLVLFFLGAKEKLKLEWKSIWLPILIIDLSAFISIFVAQDKWLAVAGYVRLLLGMGLFFLVVKAGYNKWKLITAFIGGLLLQSAVAIWQFLSQSTFSSKWLGAASHDAGALSGESVIEALDGRWLRAYGTLDHPNILGGALAAGVIITLVWLIKSSRELSFGFQWRKTIEHYSARKIIFSIVGYYAAIFFLSAGLFFSFSRAAALSLIIGIFFLAAYLIIKKKKEEQFIAGKIILAVFLLFFALSYVFNPLTGVRADPASRLENKSISERERYAKDAENILSKNFLFGVGIGNYSLAVRQADPSRPIYDYQPVHNVFLLVFAEMGILGILGLLLLLANLTYETYKYQPLNMAAILPLAVLLSFDHWMWSLHFGVLFFWLFISIIYASNREDYAR